MCCTSVQIAVYTTVQYTVIFQDGPGRAEILFTICGQGRAEIVLMRAGPGREIMSLGHL